MQVNIDPAELKPVIAETVQQTLEAIHADENRLRDRMAFSESEAARLLGLQRHQLRDCRLRGELGFSVGPARKILYSRSDLLAFLGRSRTEARVRP